MLNERTNEQTNAKTDMLEDIDEIVKIKDNSFPLFFL